MSPAPDRIFRDEALRRYVEGRRRTEPLRDVPARLLVILWTGVGLCGVALAGVVHQVTMLLSR